MNLYELTNDFKALQDMELLEEEAEQIKAIIKSEIESKGNNIIGLIKNIESDIEALKIEIKRLQDIKKAKENKIDSIKKYTKECLEGADLKKVSTPLGNISIRKNPPSVEIIDEVKIPTEYKKEVVTTSIDKKAILTKLKEGEKIEGVTLKQGTSLSIK